MNTAPYRDALLRKREELSRPPTPLDIEREPDSTDEAQKAATNAVLVGVSERERRTLREVDAALERIADGNYGACCTCGEWIGRKRLEAVPWTRLCAGCQVEAEGEGVAVWPSFYQS
jgi:DnaK suppressor protein